MHFEGKSARPNADYSAAKKDWINKRSDDRFSLRISFMRVEGGIYGKRLKRSENLIDGATQHTGQVRITK